jgi:hypothetical protein
VFEEKFVEVEEFAALTLPAHPDTLASVEDAMAMEEEEGSAALAGVFVVEVDDALGGEEGQRVGVFV